MDGKIDYRKVHDWIVSQEEAIIVTPCCKSDSEQLCDEGNLGKIKKLYTKVGDEWIEYKTK